MSGTIDHEDAVLFISNIHRHNQENDLSFLLENIEKSGSLLDVGFGTGLFLKKVASVGLRAYGVEKSAVLFTSFDTDGIAGITTYNVDFLTLNCDRLFNYITMSFFLHHTKDFAKCLCKAAGLLDENGKVYILDRMAYTCADKRAFAVFWEDEYRYAHEWHEQCPNIFTRNELELALSAVGFESPLFLSVPNDNRHGTERFPKTLAIARKR